MSKIIKISLSITILLVGIAVFYYLVIVIPRKETAYKNEIQELKKEITNTNKNIKNLDREPDDTSHLKKEIENLQYSLEEQAQEQEEEQRMESNCERFGGRYEGNGSCAYY